LPKPPPFVAISEVSVTTEFLAVATTPVMSSCWTVVWDVPPWAALVAFAEAGVVEGCGIASWTTANVEPLARIAERRAAPTIVPAVRRRRGAVATGWSGSTDADGAGRDAQGLAGAGAAAAQGLRSADEASLPASVSVGTRVVSVSHEGTRGVRSSGFMGSGLRSRHGLRV
jgi:hypothetical protein